MAANTLLILFLLFCQMAVARQAQGLIAFDEQGPYVTLNGTHDRFVLGVRYAVGRSASTLPPGLLLDQMTEAGVKTLWLELPPFQDLDESTTMIGSFLALCESRHLHVGLSFRVRLTEYGPRSSYPDRLASMLRSLNASRSLFAYEVQLPLPEHSVTPLGRALFNDIVREIHDASPGRPVFALVTSAGLLSRESATLASIADGISIDASTFNSGADLSQALDALSVGERLLTVTALPTDNRAAPSFFEATLAHSPVDLQAGTVVFGIFGAATGRPLSESELLALKRAVSVSADANAAVPSGLGDDALLQSAFAALDRKDWYRAVFYSDRVILHQGDLAAEQQRVASLSNGRSIAMPYADYWALHMVGTALYVKGRAYYEWGDQKRAATVFRELRRRLPGAGIQDSNGRVWLLSDSVGKFFPDTLPPYIEPSLVTAAIFLGVGFIYVYGSHLMRFGMRCKSMILPAMGSKGTKALGVVPAKVSSIPVLNEGEHVVFSFLLAVLLLSAYRVGVWWFHPVRYQFHVVHPALFWMLSAFGIYDFIFYLCVWHIVVNMRRPVFLPPTPGLRVATITTYVASEPLDMAKDTLLAMSRITYPHDTYVLDESDNAELKRFCSDNGIKHTSRRGIPRFNQGSGAHKAFSKGGNVNAWLVQHNTMYDLVAFFDVDHAPVPEYLDRTIGYFRDPGVGFVQPPQIYRNQESSWISQGGAEQSYLFYGPIQMGMYGKQAPVVIGSHNVIRVEALRQIGWYQVHNADDLLTSITLHAAGWKGVYVPEVLAYGVAPDSWGPYLSQQFRWAQSVLDVCHHRAGRLARNLRWEQIRSYGLLYAHYVMQPAFALLLVVPLLATMLKMAPANTSLLEFAYEWTPYLATHYALVFWAQRFLIEPDTERGLWYRAGLLWLATWPYTIAAFLMSVLPREDGPRTTTPKTKGRGTDSHVSRFWPHALYLGFLSIVVAMNWPITSGGARGMAPFLVMSAVVHAGLVFSSTAIGSRFLSRMRERARSVGRFRQFDLQSGRSSIHQFTRRRIAREGK